MKRLEWFMNFAGDETMRQWNKDGRTLNAVDARQVVEAYRAEYTPTRAKWLIQQAARNGHPAECQKVFQDAFDER